MWVLLAADLEVIDKTYLRWMHLFTTIEMWSFRSSFASRISPKNSNLEAFGMGWAFKNSRGSSPDLHTPGGGNS